jgi:hypothetical protein
VFIYYRYSELALFYNTAMRIIVDICTIIIVYRYNYRQYKYSVTYRCSKAIGAIRARVSIGVRAAGIGGPPLQRKAARAGVAVAPCHSGLGASRLLPSKRGRRQWGNVPPIPSSG